MKRLLLFLLASPCLIWGNPEKVCRHISAHLLIGDVRGACNEAVRGVGQYPRDPDVCVAGIRAFAQLGEEKEMYGLWKRYAEVVDEPYKQREVLETMAWAPILKASKAEMPSPRTLALLAALYAQSSKGVDIIQKTLHDRHRLVRALGVRVASEFQDTRLREEVYTIFRNERAGIVKLEATKALGKMGVRAAEKELLQLIGDRQADAEMRAAAISSLVSLKRGASRQEVAHLARSDRAGLRHLAAKAVGVFELNEEFDLIEKLLQDGNADVRIAALHVVGLLHPETINGEDPARVLLRMTNDPHPEVALFSARTLMFYDRLEGQALLKRWLNDPIAERRRLAAGLLSGAGAYSMPLLETAFINATDPYVKTNLALGLIGQRHCVEEACQALYAHFSSTEERWAWQEGPGFRLIAPGRFAGEHAIPDLPEATNQMVRLDVLGILAMLEFPEAQQAAKNFLENTIWGISGTAAALLLTEGDDSAAGLIESLLDDPNKKIRMQAALILALWGRGERAISILEESYAQADRDMQMRLLEALGRIGHERTIPFLVEKLSEPQHTLRLVAGAALLQTLNH